MCQKVASETRGKTRPDSVSESQLVARARSAVTGTRRASWRDAARFLTAGFPAAVYRSRHWWIPTAVVSTLLAAVIGWWIGTGSIGAWGSVPSPRPAATPLSSSPQRE